MVTVNLVKTSKPDLPDMVIMFNPSVESLEDTIDKWPMKYILAFFTKLDCMPDMSAWRENVRYSRILPTFIGDDNNDTLTIEVVDRFIKTYRQSSNWWFPG